MANRPYERSEYDDSEVPQVPMVGSKPKVEEPDKTGLPAGWRQVQLPAALAGLKQMLVKASTFEELKAVEDDAERLKMFAKVYFEEHIWTEATRLRNNARRELGKAITAYKASQNGVGELKGRGAPKIGRGRPASPALPISSGITKDVEKSARTIAKLPQPQFDAMNATGKPPTIKQLEAAGKKKDGDTGPAIRKSDYKDANRLTELLKDTRARAKGLDVAKALSVMTAKEREKAVTEIGEAVAWWAWAQVQAEGADERPSRKTKAATPLSRGKASPKSKRGGAGAGG
jgi:hypothetical protein